MAGLILLAVHGRGCPCPYPCCTRTEHVQAHSIPSSSRASLREAPADLSLPMRLPSRQRGEMYMLDGALSAAQRSTEKSARTQMCVPMEHRGSIAARRDGGVAGCLHGGCPQNEAAAAVSPHSAASGRRQKAKVVGARRVIGAKRGRHCAVDGAVLGGESADRRSVHTAKPNRRLARSRFLAICNHVWLWLALAAM